MAKVRGGERYAEAVQEILTSSDTLQDNRENKEGTDDRASKKAKNESKAKKRETQSLVAMRYKKTPECIVCLRVFTNAAITS